MQSENTFEFYRDFLNLEEANAFAEMLDANNIEHSLETSDTVIDKAIVGNGFIPKAVLKIKTEDFQKVNALISYEIASGEYSDYKDHYLNDFETEELIAIFDKPEDWTPEDTGIARIVLRERGVEISKEEIKAKREARLEEIRKGKKATYGMLGICGASVFLGLFLHLIFYIGGMGMSYYYAYGKSTDIDGQKNYIYDDETRQTGKFMFYGGFFAPVLVFLYLKAMFG